MQQALKFVDQPYYRLLEALFPAQVLAVPMHHFQSSVAPTLGKLSLKA
jgi:hypothetical protein